MLIKSKIYVILLLCNFSLIAQNFFPVNRGRFISGLAANNSGANCVNNPNGGNCGSYTLISPSSGNGNDTSRIQRIINRAPNGQTLVFATGVYNFRNLVLKSNIRIKTQRGVVFKPFLNGVNIRTNNVNMFRIGVTSNGSQSVSNISISSVTNNVADRFKFDFRGIGPGTRGGITCFGLGRVSNFRIANFQVDDSFTRLQCIAFTPQGNTERVTFGGQTGVRYTSFTGMPTGGIIENANVTNAAFGYGLIQIQAGSNILFKNLSGTGGATLRLESGAFGIAHALPNVKRQIFFDELYGDNISATNGHTAVMVSPHTVNHGNVHFRNIKATSCAVGFRVSKGFTTPDEEANPRIPGPGHFDSVTFEGSINVRSGNNAQLKRNQHFRLVNCATRSLFNPSTSGTGQNQTGDLESFRAQSVAAATLFGADLNNTKRDQDGFSDVSLNIDAQSTRRLRNRRNSFNNPNPTPNGLLVDADAARDINCRGRKDIESQVAVNNELTVGPNPAKNYFNISGTSNGSSVNIYSISGNLVKSVASTTNEIKVNSSEFGAGIYILEISTGNKTVMRRIVIE